MENIILTFQSNVCLWRWERGVGRLGPAVSSLYDNTLDGYTYAHTVALP